jgi:TRAP-type C4-dicarboxylate transport system permease small subunit
MTPPIPHPEPLSREERVPSWALQLSIERLLLALAMALLCVITMANVVVRYFTNFSFAFTEEISVSLLVFMTLIGTASAFRNDNHIHVTLLVDRLPGAARRAVQVFALGASCVMFGVLAWYGTRMAWDDYRYEVTSPALGVPQWIYSAWLPLLSLLTVLRLMQLIRARLRGLQ